MSKGRSIWLRAKVDVEVVVDLQAAIHIVHIHLHQTYLRLRNLKLAATPIFPTQHSVIHSDSPADRNDKAALLHNYMSQTLALEYQMQVPYSCLVVAAIKRSTCSCASHFQVEIGMVACRM